MRKPGQFEKFSKHVAKHSKDGMLPCPVCKSRNWHAEGPFVLLPVDLLPERKARADFSLKGAVPVAALVCKTCGFLRTFAWLSVSGAGET